MERTVPITATPAAGFVALAASWLLAGCDIPTALDLSVSIENPQLTELHVELQVSDAVGTLTVTAVPEDGSYAPSDEVRARVEITTELGDAEELLLRPGVCTLDDGTEYFCGWFGIMMDDEHLVTEIEPYLDEIAGTLHLPMVIGAFHDTTYLTPISGTIEIATGDMEPALERAANWPHVKFVEALTLGRQHGGLATDAPLANDWRGSLSCGRAGPAPHDGVVQIAAGGSITAQYRQPDGSVLTVTRLPPEWGAT